MFASKTTITKRTLHATGRGGGRIYIKKSREKKIINKSVMLRNNWFVGQAGGERKAVDLKGNVNSRSPIGDGNKHHKDRSLWHRGDGSSDVTSGLSSVIAACGRLQKNGKGRCYESCWVAGVLVQHMARLLIYLTLSLVD